MALTVRGLPPPTPTLVEQSLCQWLKVLLISKKIISFGVLQKNETSILTLMEELIFAFCLKNNQLPIYQAVASRRLVELLHLDSGQF